MIRWIAGLMMLILLETSGSLCKPALDAAEAPPAVAEHPAEHLASGAEHAAEDGSHELGHQLPLYSVLPFALMLLSIALFPLVHPHWWERNRHKAVVAAILGIPTAGYLASFGEAGVHALEHAGMEYVSFLLLLGSLFVISGGIYVRGTLQGSPVLNTALLGLGTVLASFVGTTGASMLLIRPLLRANERRLHVVHVVIFFIFTVSNCGGLLTPLGDPPLFLGFLKGVPFDWTFRLTREWALVNGSLLVIFFIWDSIVSRWEQVKEPGAMELEASIMHSPEPLGVEGLHNVLFLGAIVGIIYGSGRGLGNGGQPWPWGISESLMLLTAVSSYVSTSSQLRMRNRFSFGPIIEVAVLFAGIFVTMIPALQILNVNGKNLGVTEPWQFFWATGMLSSFLDNAPTYLTFAATACGIQGVPLEGPYLATYLALPPETQAEAIIAAISCGAVFMGANTYIGNGPNFMVKAIAEEYNIRMPGFFGYMVYSVLVLLPLFVLVTSLFFR